MTQNNSTKPPLLIIAGPTASGKSDAAVALAKRMNGAVISADSMQVYRHMDIGSAKIRKDEMQGIDHYLLDCVDPTEEWNVVRFQQLAREAAAKITREGKLPILCGGTGFYIRALLYGTQFTETETDTTYREACYKQAKTPEEFLRVIDRAESERIEEESGKEAKAQAERAAKQAV